jgi:hypothetical protein
MVRHLVAISTVLLTVARAFAAEPDVVEDVHQLEKLVAEVRGVVPDGWSVELKISTEYLRSVRPVIVITSDKKLPVEHLGINPPAAGQAEKETVKIWMAFMAYLSPDEHAAAQARNERLKLERLEFFEKHLQQGEYAWMGPPPPSPDSIEPRSPVDLRLARQYALLWLATEPTQLPTHYYGQLAVWHDPHGIAIHDAEGKKQYEQIVEGLERILTPYQKKGAG